MTAVFETPRFRVHIAGKTAWVENRESAGWVFKAQSAIPVAAEALTAMDQDSAVGAALLDFENARPGDRSLRIALTGYRKPDASRIPLAVKVQIKPARMVSQASVARKRQDWRGPVRPPLKPCFE